MGLWICAAALPHLASGGGDRLSASNHQQLWVPVGFAHGSITLSVHAEVLYKTNDFWSRDCERSLRWDDPTLAITWQREARGNSGAQLSEKDAAAPRLASLPAVGHFRCGHG